MNHVPFEHSKSVLQDPIRFPSVGHAIEAGYYSGRVLHGHESLSRIPRGAPGCFCQMTWRWIIHPAHAARWRWPDEKSWHRNSSWCRNSPSPMFRFQGRTVYIINPLHRGDTECRDSKNAFQCSSSRPCIKRVSLLFFLKQLRILWRKFARLVTSRRQFLGRVVRRCARNGGDIARLYNKHNGVYHVVKVLLSKDYWLW